MATQDVTLNPGESKLINFNATPHEARVYQVNVDGLTGSFKAVSLEPHLISLDLPSVPSGSEFYPEYSLFLPKPWNKVENPLYGLSLSIDHPSGSKRKRARLVGIAIMPYQADTVLAPPDAWLKNPDGIYTYRGTFVADKTEPWQRRWGPSQAVWGDDTFIKPGTYPVKGILSADNCIGISYYGWETGAPQKSWNLGVVGYLTVTEQELPDPVMAGRILGFHGLMYGDPYITNIYDGATIRVCVPGQYSECFWNGYFGVAFHNDTVVAGTSAEVDPRKADRPFEIVITLDGSFWWSSGIFDFDPCKPYETHEVGGPIRAGKFPPLGSHTITAVMLSNDKILDTYTISITVVQ